MMKKSKISIIGTAIFAAILIMTLLFLRYNENRSYEERGESLISKVEDYRQRTGNLPDSVSDLGMEEEMGDGPYYKKQDSLHYIVYFNIGFDHSKTYYSKTQEWQDEP
jgi:hypothetical protein